MWVNLDNIGNRTLSRYPRFVVALRKYLAITHFRFWARFNEPNKGSLNDLLTWFDRLLIVTGCNQEQMVVNMSIYQAIKSGKNDLDLRMDKVEPTYPFRI